MDAELPREPESRTGIWRSSCRGAQDVRLRLQWGGGGGSECWVIYRHSSPCCRASACHAVNPPSPAASPLVCWTPAQLFICCDLCILKMLTPPKLRGISPHACPQGLFSLLVRYTALEPLPDTLPAKLMHHSKLAFELLPYCQIITVTWNIRNLQKTEHLVYKNVLKMEEFCNNKQQNLYAESCSIELKMWVNDH